MADAGDAAPVCAWVWSIDASSYITGEDFWATSCGRSFCFTDGGPRENGFVACPFCGLALTAPRVTDGPPVDIARESADV